MQNLNGSECEELYDGSEMDEVDSPPLRMLALFIGLTIIGFLYVFIWVFLLTP